jgi:hypothetical protein
VRFGVVYVESKGMASNYFLFYFMIGAQQSKYTKGLNIVRHEVVNSAKLEIQIGMGMPAKERIRVGSGDIWRKPRMRCNGIRSG